MTTAKKVRVGFQGTAHSFSEAAAKKLAEGLDVEDSALELVPLKTSRNVLESVRSDKVEYGVVAYQNVIGGMVTETEEIFKDEINPVLDKHILDVCFQDIDQCVFVKNAEVPPEYVREVHSHPQALAQCRETLRQLFSDFQAVEEEDTADSAAKLASGELRADCAVVCPEQAGLAYGLHLIKKSAQDRPINRTMFILFKLKAGNAKERDPWLSQILLKLFSKEQNLKYFIQFTLLVTIFCSYPLKTLSEWLLPVSVQLSFPEAILAMIGLSTGIIYFLMSSDFRTRIQYRNILGYWIYNDMLRAGEADSAQDYSLPRAVIIDNGENGLRIRGWLCEDTPKMYFTSNIVLHSDLYKKDGHLIYKYNNYNSSRKWAFNGIVELRWDKPTNTDPITRMHGSYHGFMTNTDGALHYKRVNKETFLKFCHIDPQLAKIEL